MVNYNDINEVNMPVRTNCYQANINYDKLLDRYNLFQIKVTCKEFKHASIYVKLEKFHEDCPLTAVVFYNIKKEKSYEEDKELIAKEYLLITASESINTIIIRDALKKDNDIKDIMIDQFEIYQLHDLEQYHLLNLMLNLLPNQEESLSYACGKLLVGGCNDWNDKYEKKGEYKFLQVYFNKKLCFCSSVRTLTCEAKFPKYKRDKLSHRLKFYLRYGSDDNVYVVRTFSADKDSEEDGYYELKNEHKGNRTKNTIDFLDISSLNRYHGCQAYVLNNILQKFQETFGDIVDLTPITYLETKYVCSTYAENKLENSYMDDFSSNTSVEVQCYDSENVVNRLNDFKQKMQKELLSSFKSSVNEMTYKDTAVIRIVPSFSDDKQLPVDKRMIEKKKQCIHKLNYLKQGIPVQDVSVDDIGINKSVITNLFRQLVIKKYVLRKQLPTHIAERYKGFTFVYACKIAKTKYYHVAKLCINSDASCEYKCRYVQSVENTISIDDVEISTVSLGSSYLNSEIFAFNNDDILTYIYDMGEFVFPHLDYIEQDLKSRAEKNIASKIYEDTLEFLKSAEGDFTDAVDLCQQRIKSQKKVSFNMLIKEHLKIANGNKELKKRLKQLRFQNNITKTVTPQFKNKSECPISFGSYMDIYFWPMNDYTNWRYTVGMKSKSINTKTVFENKTHMRYVKTSKPVTDEYIKKYIIDALQDGWLRMSSYSVHPSVFKFMQEALEIDDTKLIALGTIPDEVFEVMCQPSE